MSEIITQFIELCSQEDISSWANERKFDLELLKRLRIGICESEVLAGLKKRYSVKELRDAGFIRDGGFTYYNRIIIPYTQDYFAARSIQNDSIKKNLFPKGKKKIPYYINGSNDTCYITEGETDAIRLKQEYPDSSVFSLGGVNSYKLIQNISTNFKGKKLILAFDNDEAGSKCLNDTLKFLPDQKYEIYKLQFPQEIKDIDEFFFRGGNKDQLQLQRLHSESIYAKSTLQDMEILNVAEALKQGIPEIKYIIDPLLRKGGITIIGGEPGAKKSLLAMMMGISIAKGVSLFDKYEVSPCKVMYLDFENGLAVMLNRFQSLINGTFVGDDSGLDNVSLGIFYDLKFDDDKCLPILRYLIGQTKAEVFIIDSLVRTLKGDEDKSSDIRKIFDYLKHLLKEDISFIIVHHTRKDNKRGMSGLRGSGDLGGFPDAVLMLDPKGDAGQYTNVTLEKHRHLGVSACNDWGFLVDDVSFEREQYLKLVHYDKCPDDQTKSEQCYHDLLEWIDKTYASGNEFKTGAAAAAMDKLGGYSRIMVSDRLKLLHSKKIIEKQEKQGYWRVP